MIVNPLYCKECPICFDDKVKFVTLHCEHSYCQDCYTQWKQINNTCPFCRNQQKNNKCCIIS